MRLFPLSELYFGIMKDMQSSTLIPVEEYLNRSYRPDCEYLEGTILERNVGEWEHARLQMRVSARLFSREKEWRIRVVPEQRVQLKAERFRVPDVCVISADTPVEPILRRPPFLCVEILSREDRMSEMLERVEDYLSFGVRYVWVIDPRRRWAQIHAGSDVHEMKNGMLWTAGPDILVSIDQLFD
jgi:Uma2 family endonuclease